MSASARKSAPESFEASLRKLEELVRDMEGGSLTLDQMLTAFEEGSRLAQVCHTRLNEVERRIEMLVQKGDAVVAEPFPEPPEAEDPSHAPRA
jgi:exodeoxyribonuclease VII small subunit